MYDSTRHLQLNADRYARDSAGHRLTVLHDDGLHRHLRYSNPQPGGLYGLDLITWPGGMAVRGDGPNFVFSTSPTADPLQLFRGSGRSGINPGYWQEKVHGGQVKAWSPEKFLTWLDEALQRADKRTPGTAAAFDEHILNGEHDLEHEETARYAVAAFEYGNERLRYPAKWERDFDAWSWEFLWACHAIIDIIAAYDLHRAELAPRNVYLDTEFLASDPTLRGLISIGLTDEDGNDYYAVNAGMDFAAVAAHPWLSVNVLPYLPLTPDGELDHTHPHVKPAEQIAADVAAYFTDHARAARLHAHWGDQDLVRLHQLWDNDWDAMPRPVPRWHIDLQALRVLAGNPDLPPQDAGHHHALDDARHNRTIHQHLRTLPLAHR